MKSITKNTLFLASLFLLLLNFSCKKSSEETATFTWTYLGIPYNATYSGAFKGSLMPGPTIIGHLGSSLSNQGEGLRIALTSFSTGNYLIGAGTPATFLEYVNHEGTPFNATSGSINITAYNNSRISGNFSVTVNGGAGVSGSFSKVVVEE